MTASSADAWLGIAIPRVEAPSVVSTAGMTAEGLMDAYVDGSAEAFDELPERSAENIEPLQSMVAGHDAKHGRCVHPGLSMPCKAARSHETNMNPALVPTP